jgi:hypothetical protein
MPDETQIEWVKPKSFKEFWPIYVREHRRLGCRRLHFLGTSISTALIIFALSTHQLWYLPVAVIIGYSFSWTGHFFIEGNRPASLKAPAYSLRGDYRMFWMMLVGRMDSELKRCCLTEP